MRGWPTSTTSGCSPHRGGPQRPLWASTSVKDPAYPDTRYVTELVAPGVVNTMPEATLRAVAGHGQVPADSVHGHYDESQQVLGQLQELGLGYDDIMQGLEDDAVTKFDAAWEQLGGQLAAELRARPARQHGS
jgi:transaldolase